MLDLVLRVSHIFLRMKKWEGAGEGSKNMSGQTYHMPPIK